MPILSRSLWPAFPLLAIALTGPVALSTPSAANAAAAPARAFTVGTDGYVLGDSTHVVGLSQDASEVIWNGRDTYNASFPVPLARNLVTGVTTVLGTSAESAISTSSDLQKVFFTTTRPLDAIADKNTSQDFYVLDRQTNKTTLVSRASTGGPSIEPANHTGYSNGTGVMSTDGNTFFYDDSATQATAPHVYKFDLATGTVTIVGAGTLLPDQTVGATGRVVATTKYLYVGGARRLLPPNIAQVRSSPDGSAIATSQFGNGTIGVANTATGNFRSMPHPSVFNTQPAVVSIVNGGSTVTLQGGVVPSDPDAASRVDGIAQVDLGSKVATRVGGDLPTGIFGGYSRLITDDGAFVANDQVISAIGAKPVPGVDAVSPAPPANAYLLLAPGCKSGGLFEPAVRPSLYLVNRTVGDSPRVPASATVKVVAASNGVTTNSFTLQPAKRASTTAGFGNFTVTTTVKFTDGTSSTGSKFYPSYTPITHTIYPDIPGVDSCLDAQQLS